MRLIPSPALALLLLSVACRTGDKPAVDTGGLDGTTPDTTDADGDGYVASEDCDDNNSLIHPGAAELCDGADNNCDGSIDEGVTSTFYADDDADGFGDALATTEACEIPAGHAAVGNDCDDTDADTYPGAAERCDGQDNDCDGTVDEDIQTTWYADADEDGHGDPDSAYEVCDPPPGYVSSADDCDDTDDSSFPGGTEVCDEADNDCDGTVDEDVTTTFYQDTDGDNYGVADITTEACAEPTGYAAEPGDCDDTQRSISPSAPELCDGQDNDCDGSIDEDDAEDAATFYADADSDGYGDTARTTVACAAPSGYVANSDDCDDSTDAVSPAAAEVCDEQDNDCDGTTDEPDATDASRWYADSDGDGYGTTSSTVACDQPSGFAAVGGDCNDASAAANPGETEVCDSIDNDCDSSVDEGVTSTYYLDYDRDGYGDAARTTAACSAPSGYTSDRTDCDDTEATTNPGASEVCDGADNDCDGTIDEASAADVTTWYADDDGDGYGGSDSARACEAPSGYVDNSDDCDDADPLSFPDGPEYRDEVDNDCDGDTDEELWKGTGADGALTVTGTTDLHVDASGTRTAADAVAYAVSAISGATVTLTETPAGIAAGDEVLLINLHGSDSAYSAAGTYEFASVASVSGKTVTLMLSVAEIYGETSNSDLSGQAVVLQRVPHYTDVEVRAGGFLTGTPWDGERYGIVAFRATDTVSIEDGGAISADELGYWGGETGTCLNCDAFQGESYAGAGDGDYLGGPYNQANGAYAANYGGGGANVTGGGGEYAGGATAGASWNGGGYTAPAAGSTYGSASLSALFFGSGGGGVWNGGTDTTGEDPGPGGDGGGILLIGADSIEADGADALTAFGGSTTHWASGTWTYGAAGGAGGSIYLIADTLTLPTDAVGASGGLGQASYTRIGGDGGDGRIRIDFTTLNGDSQGTAAADAELLGTCEPDAGYDDTP